MIPSIPRLSDYDVSALHGFLPTDPPCDHLSDPYYRHWESIMRNLQALISTKRLRAVIDKQPILYTDFLHTEAEWRRAYSILGFMAHAYIWGGDTPMDRVPPSISVPFLSTCEHLELPSVATYAAVVLWNWKPLLLNEPIDNLENIYTLNTFTGSLDESWFYLVSAAIEARGAPIIPIMLDAVAAARYNDSETVTECLRSFAERLDELATLLVRMYENCDPHVFYNRIRPYLAGSKNMAEAGLPNGVIFDTGSGADTYVQHPGGSNAQSSIIQFFDLVLGVEHRPTGMRPPGTSDASSASESENRHPVGSPNNNFILEMRKYMPGPHRRFLEHIGRVANIRQYVFDHRDNRALSTAFDACLAMLRAFRDKHIQMVSRYIIVKSRESRSHTRSISPTVAKGSVMNLATASSKSSEAKRKLRGTGGTALIPFLKQARDETGEPAIDAWARRLLSNGPGPAEYADGVTVKAPLGAGARLTKMGEHASGEMEIVGLAGVWRVDDSEGGICHW
ncbi:Indoleamine 2,3-dioxygenase [Tothia fuscella]|uniref:Indoleamine 2,3-dioxygenase n=1 Tax=Tothia fuscella TaxID=1048955 RepID=A0A9P4TU66_9PEZI|nr:Indoleamine 2,3-dioxygenase [Tothia fuscella]